MCLNQIKEEFKISSLKVVDVDNFNYLFSGKITFEDLIVQVVFEVIKNEFYKNDLKDSLYQWVKKSEMISEFEYQSYKRVMKYVRYYKEELKKELSQIINVEEIEELNLNDMDSVENRLKGYRLNSFHFIQLINIQMYPLLKKIVDKSICSNKKIDNSKFVELHEELDEYFLSLKQNNDNLENYFKQMIHFYEIEKNYSTEIVYKIATIVEEKNIAITEDLVSKLGIIFNFSIPINGTEFHCENRFLAHRHYFIEEIINPILNEKGISTDRNQLLNILYLKNLLTKDRSLIDTIINHDRIEILSLIMDNYPLFTIVEKKEWNNKKIRIAREIYAGILNNIKNPEIRT